MKQKQRNKRNQLKTAKLNSFFDFKSKKKAKQNKTKQQNKTKRSTLNQNRQDERRKQIETNNKKQINQTKDEHKTQGEKNTPFQHAYNTIQSTNDYVVKNDCFADYVTVFHASKRTFCFVL
jgi:hypothetical protein